MPKGEWFRGVCKTPRRLIIWCLTWGTGQINDSTGTHMEYFVTIESGNCKDTEQVGEIYDKLSRKKKSRTQHCACAIVPLRKEKEKILGLCFSDYEWWRPGLFLWNFQFITNRDISINTININDKNVSIKGLYLKYIKNFQNSTVKYKQSTN